MQRALILLNLFGHEAVRHMLQNRQKMHFLCFLPVLEPHGHIVQGKSMPFASFNPTNPRTNPWNFGGNCSAFDEVEKLSFFKSAILNFLKKQTNFFASSPWKLVTNHVLEWMGLNFYYYDGLQPKMRTGIIELHECILQVVKIIDRCWCFVSKVVLAFYDI